MVLFELAVGGFDALGAERLLTMTGLPVRLEPPSVRVADEEVEGLDALGAVGLLTMGGRAMAAGSSALRVGGGGAWRRWGGGGGGWVGDG